MSPLLGIWASSIQGSKATSFDSISTVTLSGSQSTVSFSSIPSTYKHLQLRFIARTDLANPLDGLKLTFNSDTGTTNYRSHFLIGDGSGVGADTSSTVINIGNITASQASSGQFGAGIVDILDYTSTNKNKTTRTLVGEDRNGAGSIRLISGLWFATPVAITGFTISSVNAANLVQYSTFALYGIKG